MIDFGLPEAAQVVELPIRKSCASVALAAIDYCWLPLTLFPENLPVEVFEALAHVSLLEA